MGSAQQQTATPCLSSEKSHCYSLNKRKILTAGELTMHITNCALNSRHSQQVIYESFFDYAMAVAGRYAEKRDDAIEILNDGFLKVFKQIHRFSPAYSDVVSSFKGWLRKIIVYTAIDHFRRNQKHHFTTELDDVVGRAEVSENALDKISYEEIMKTVRQLTPGYRTVFNLFVIEGYSHEQIASELGISTGASKSNLAKARKHLQLALTGRALHHKKY